MRRAAGTGHGAGALLVALLAIGLHMAVFDRGLGGDGWTTFAFVESVLDDGDTRLENNLRGMRNGVLQRDDGHLVMQYPPGMAALDLVPVLLGRAVDRILPAGVLAAGLDVAPVGRLPRQTILEIAAVVAFRNVAVVLGTWWVAAALAALGSERGAAWVAAATTFFAGPLLFYALVGMNHAPAYALSALVFLLLARGGFRPDVRGALLTGVVVGAATLVRYGAIALLVPLLAACSGKGWVRKWAAALAGAGIPLLVLPLFYRLHHGRWLPLPYGGEVAATLTSPWNILLSTHHGLFVFHPALVLGFAGLVSAASGRSSAWRRAARVALVWVLAVAVLHGSWSEWANAGGWGQRFMIDALPAFALGFAALLATRFVRPLVLAPLAVLLVVGYGLFFAAVSRLAPAPDGLPWPQSPADYRGLLVDPPSPGQWRHGLFEASISLRTLFPAGRAEANGEGGRRAVGGRP